jgi:hypothetical protein
LLLMLALGHPHRSAGKVVENWATRPKLFSLYDLSDMKKGILFGFYHLAKNKEGGGVSGAPLFGWARLPRRRRAAAVGL